MQIVRTVTCQFTTIVDNSDYKNIQSIMQKSSYGTNVSRNRKNEFNRTDLRAQVSTMVVLGNGEDPRAKNNQDERECSVKLERVKAAGNIDLSHIDLREVVTYASASKKRYVRRSNECARRPREGGIESQKMQRAEKRSGEAGGQGEMERKEIRLKMRTGKTGQDEGKQTRGTDIRCRFACRIVCNSDVQSTSWMGASCCVNPDRCMTHTNVHLLFLAW